MRERERERERETERERGQEEEKQSEQNTICCDRPICSGACDTKPIFLNPKTILPPPDLSAVLPMSLRTPTLCLSRLRGS